MHGRDEVARLLVAVAANVPAGLDIRYRSVNGDPASILFERGVPFAVLVLDLNPERDAVRRVFSVTNPDELSRVGG
ncbi:hypothetical protein [Micromonospora cremea]|uniref:hypothetical protein n=1 Tax=Micromonospora cremea TaxID=709881 RepID=UPI00117E7A9E|nr:hypothetical protein [Micromonospora cremea]